MVLTIIILYLSTGLLFTFLSCYDMFRETWDWDLQSGAGLAAVGVPGWILWVLGILLAPLTVYSFFRSWIRHFRGYYPY